MKLYIASGMAHHSCQIAQQAFAVMAETETAASAGVYELLLSVKPIAVGWYNHAVIVTEIPYFTLRSWAENCLITNQGVH